MLDIGAWAVAFRIACGGVGRSEPLCSAGSPSKDAGTSVIGSNKARMAQIVTDFFGSGPGSDPHAVIIAVAVLDIALSCLGPSPMDIGAMAANRRGNAMNSTATISSFVLFPRWLVWSQAGELQSAPG